MPRPNELPTELPRLEEGMCQEHHSPRLAPGQSIKPNEIEGDAQYVAERNEYPRKNKKRDYALDKP